MPTFSSMAFFSFSLTSACVLPRTFLMMDFPVSESRPTVYRPSHRPSFRFRILPSPFARLFGMVSAPFATNNTVTKGTKLPESRTVIRKLSFAPSGLCRLIFAYCSAISALPGTFSLVTAVRFSDGQEALFIDYSGAKYTRFPPKIAVAQKHFFVRLKTAISSAACGTSTLKSPPPRAFSVPDIHL